MNHHHNHYLADWSSFDQPDHLLSHKKSTGADNNELVELLWRDGQVVLQTQTPKRIINQNANNPLSDLIQDDETVSWINYPFPDTAAAADETEFCSNVLSEFPDFPGGALDPNEGISKQLTNHQEVAGKECSVMTVGSSNRFPAPPTQCFPSATKKTPPFLERNTAAAGTSSSGGSGSGDGSTFSKIGGKRKRSLDFNEESECQSESAELDRSSGLNKAVKLSKSGRRARAAEVHNLSERRRRDRINEKMKALQELIPNSTKTDKASMLDEAIDYLKSLQLQLQVMWMGNGMAAQGVMFPGMQHYMSRLGMGMGLGMGLGMTGHPLPHISGGIPLINNHHQPSSSHSHQAVIPPTQLVNSHNNISSDHQIQHHNNHISQAAAAVAAQAAFSDQYAQLMAFHLQPTPSSTQAMNMFRFGSQTALQQQQQQQQFRQNIMAPPPPPPGTSSTGGPSTQIIASQK